MKKLFLSSSATATLTAVLLSLLWLDGRAQFWTENFDPAKTGWTLNNNGGQWGDFGDNTWVINTSGPSCGSANWLHVTETSGSLCGGTPGAYTYCNSGTDRYAASPNISTVGQSGMTLQFWFKSRGGGCTSPPNDYGMVGLSNNGGSSWTWLSTKYFNISSCTQTSTISIPATYEGITNFRIAFRWISETTCGSNFGSPFAVDNIVINSSVCVPPAITSHPSSSAICAGSNTSFSISASGSTPSYQWQVSTNGGGIWNNITSAGSNPTYANWTTVTLGVNSVAAGNNGYKYRCIASNGCGSATSNDTNLTVNPSNPVSVSIAASPSGPICAGTSVTFTATPVNGGASPSYQWKKNGSNVGTNSSTYTDGGLVNGNQIWCVLTSNVSCPIGNPATSNTITMTVNSNNPVSVSIAASPSGSICAGTNVTFTATPVNGGASPSYQWKKNGSNAGTNSNTYSDAGLANGDQVWCVLTSNATCPTGNPATSNTITMQVYAAPVITSCPSDVTVNNDPGTCGAVVNYPPATASGNPPPGITYSQNSGTVFSGGTTAITVSATNTCGTATCNFNVTVNDNEDPAITCPADKNVSVNAADCKACSVPLGTPVTSDNCGVASVSSNAPACFAVGTTEVQWTVTDISGRTAACSQNVTVAPNVISISEIITHVSCFGGSDGSIDLTVTGSASPFSFLWSNAATTGDISGLAAGTYTVTVTDAFGCTASAMYSISQPMAISINGTVTDVTGCSGLSNGSIDITAGGGTSPYGYLWNGGSTDEDRTGLTAGTYTVTITDANGCTASASFTVNEPEASIRYTYGVNNTAPYCGPAQLNPGAAGIALSGSAPPFVFQWFDNMNAPVPAANGGNTPYIHNMQPGSYYITIADNNGCALTQFITIQ